MSLVVGTLHVRITVIFVFLSLLGLVSASHAQSYDWVANPSTLATYKIAALGNVISLALRNQSGSFEDKSGLSFEVTQLKEVAANGTVLQQVNLNSSAWAKRGVFYNETQLGQVQNGTNTIGLYYDQGPIVVVNVELTEGRQLAKVTIAIANFAFRESTSKLILKAELLSNSTIAFDGNRILTTKTSLQNVGLVFTWNDTANVDGSPYGQCGTLPTCNLNAPVGSSVRDANSALGDLSYTKKVVEFQYPYFARAVYHDPSIGVTTLSSGTGGGNGLLTPLTNQLYVIAAVMVVLLLVGTITIVRRRKRTTATY